MFVKQYGARRSGTNALRALIQGQLPTVEVLMHVLGDKHGAPARLVRGREVDTSRDAAELVWEATLEVPSRTTCRDDVSQQAFIAREAASLVDALRRGGLVCVLSAKDPYAWLASILKAEGWLPARRASGQRRPLPRDRWPEVRRACRSYREDYDVWLACAEERPAGWSIVRHEDLVTRPSFVLQGLCEILGVERGGDTAPLLAGVVRPTHWDDERSHEHVHVFDAGYYVERRYLDELDAAARQILEEEIDWERLAPLGYGPLDGQRELARVSSSASPR